MASYDHMTSGIIRCTRDGAAHYTRVRTANQYLPTCVTWGVTRGAVFGLTKTKQGLLLDNNGNVIGLDSTFLNNLDNDRPNCRAGWHSCFI